MANAEDLFYVYMYIDPRNLRPFYYGKGKGSRQFSHLLDTAESDKTAKIREIRKEGLEPTIRIVAKGLSEDQALLVEKTLIWTSSELANIATGSFSRNFRPPNTLHKKLPNFDYPNQVHYFNVGDGVHRRWEDNVTYGYLGAGQKRVFRKAIERLHPGDIVIARLNEVGYVGVGRVMSDATPARDFRVPKFAKAASARGRLLIDLNLRTAVKDNLDDLDLCEYMVAVDWIKTVDRSVKYWKKNAHLFAHRGTTQASLANQPATIDFVERCFEVKIDQLANVASGSHF